MNRAKLVLGLSIGLPLTAVSISTLANPFALEAGSPGTGCDGVSQNGAEIHASPGGNNKDACTNNQVQTCQNDGTWTACANP